MQNQLLHGLAHKIVVGYHAPKEFPDYEPLAWAGDKAEERTEPTEADNVALRSFFMFQAKRSANGG